MEDLNKAVESIEDTLELIEDSLNNRRSNKKPINTVNRHASNNLIVPPSHKDKGMTLNKTDKHIEIEGKVKDLLWNAFKEIMQHPSIIELKNDYSIQYAAGLSNGSLAAIRKSRNPSYSTIVKLCYICGVQAHTLLKGL